MRALTSLIAFCGVSLFGQELNLDRHLQRLKSAPGATVADKVQFLSGVGVTLSSQGMRELEQSAAANRHTNNIWRSTTSSYGQTGDTWLSPAKRRSNGSSNDPAPDTDWNRSWSSTTSTIGQYDYYNSSNAVSGTSNRIGNQTYYNFNNGVSGTSSDVGNYRYHNLNNGLNGTSNRVGQYDYHNFNNGVSGTSNRIGNYTYHNSLASKLAI